MCVADIGKITNLVRFESNTTDSFIYTPLTPEIEEGRWMIIT